jgi:hypothetical protein
MGASLLEKSCKVPYTERSWCIVTKPVYPRAKESTMKKPREIHKVLALSIAMLTVYAVSVSIIFSQESAAAETNICWALDANSCEFDTQISEWTTSINTLEFTQAPQRRAREGQATQNRREAETIQRTTEETLKKFPTPEQIATIPNKAQREHFQKVRNLLERAQREAHTWSRNQQQRFLRQMNTLVNQFPFGKTDRPIVMQKPKDGPGTTCQFCTGIPEGSSCTGTCRSEFMCCLSEGGCWTYDQQKRICTQEDFLCSLPCILTAELCFADCFFIFRPPDKTLPQDPKVKPE